MALENQAKEPEPSSQSAIRRQRTRRVVPGSPLKAEVEASPTGFSPLARAESTDGTTGAGAGGAGGSENGDEWASGADKRLFQVR
jgi:hypothetical protein